MFALPNTAQRRSLRKLLSGNLLFLHAGQFSEITIPHFLFAGADEVIE
jgi:hypothetical protein